MELQELNQKYYALFGELFFNRSLLPDKQLDVMNNALSRQYLRDLEFCLMENELAHSTERFELRFKYANYLPRRRWWLFGRPNRIGRALLKQFVEQFNNYLLGIAPETTVSEQPDAASEAVAVQQTEALIERPEQIVTVSKVDDENAV